MRLPSPEELKEFRESNRWTQGELAQKLGVGRTTYTNYEYGASRLPLRLLSVLQELGWSIDGRPKTSARSEAILSAMKGAHMVELPVRRGILAGKDGDECYFTSSDDGSVEVPSFLLSPDPEERALYSVVVAAGNSMRERINPGDYLVVRREDDTERLLNRLVIAMDENRGREYVKIYRWNAARDLAELHSINDTYPPMTPGPGWRIVAGVTAIYDPHGRGSKNIEHEGGYLRA